MAVPREKTVPLQPMLVELCGGALRYGVLRALFEQPGRELHLRGLAAAAGVDSGNAHRMLQRLVQAGLVEQVKGELYPRYRARHDNPLHAELTALFSRGSELMDALREVAAGIEGYVAVYGSVARGEDRADSDVDVLVIGPISNILAQAAFKPLARRYRRKINATAAEEKDVLRQLGEGSLFWRDVLTGPLITLKGSPPDEVARRLSEGKQQGVPAKSRRSGRDPKLAAGSRR